MPDTSVFELPAGTTVTMHLERNNSTTITFEFPFGITYVWNSGVFMACNILGTGPAIMVTAFTANPAMGFLTQRLVSYGCTKLADINFNGGGGDGRGSGLGFDVSPSYGPNPTQSDPKIPGGYWQEVPVTIGIPGVAGNGAAITKCAGLTSFEVSRSPDSETVLDMFVEEPEANANIESQLIGEEMDVSLIGVIEQNAVFI